MGGWLAPLLAAEGVDDITLPDQGDPVASRLHVTVPAVDRVPSIHEFANHIPSIAGHPTGLLADGTARAHQLEVAVQREARFCVPTIELSLVALDQVVHGVLAGRCGAVLTGRASDLRVDGRAAHGDEDADNEPSDEDVPSVHDGLRGVREVGD